MVQFLTEVKFGWISSFLSAVPRNYDPTLHPFEVPREYTRALNATKLDRVFAKPFVASLDGHRDGINCIARHARNLSTVMSGACDGQVHHSSPNTCTLLIFISRISTFYPFTAVQKCWCISFKPVMFPIGKDLEPEQARVPADAPSSRRLRQGNMLALLRHFVFHGTPARFPLIVHICWAFWSFSAVRN